MRPGREGSHIAGRHRNAPQNEIVEVAGRRRGRGPVQAFDYQVRDAICPVWCRCRIRVSGNDVEFDVECVVHRLRRGARTGDDQQELTVLVTVAYTYSNVTG